MKVSPTRPIKTAVMLMALAAVSPMALIELLLHRLFQRDVLFLAQGHLLSLMPGKVGNYVRNAYYWFTLKKCALNCSINFGSFFTHSEAEINDHVYIGQRCILGMVKIKDYVMLADHVYVLSGRHQHGTLDPSIPFQLQEKTLISIEIGANSWVGTNVVLMNNVGSNCVVGAGSVVVHSVPDDSVAVGNPARVIKSSATRMTIFKANEC